LFNFISKIVKQIESEKVHFRASEHLSLRPDTGVVNRVSEHPQLNPREGFFLFTGEMGFVAVTLFQRSDRSNEGIGASVDGSLGFVNIFDGCCTSFKCRQNRFYFYPLHRPGQYRERCRIPMPKNRTL